MKVLENCRVAISVSDPEPAEMARHGVGGDHVRHAFVELARQILAYGGDLSYGGDLRKGGYTETLSALVHTYSGEDRPAPSRIAHFLAERPGEGAGAEAEAAERPWFDTVMIHPEAGPERLSWPAALAQMRLTMTERAHARVVLGGRLHGQSGLWPGVVEEAYHAVRLGCPLFVLGGLGGAASRVSAALRGERVEELTTPFQVERTEAHGYLFEAGKGPSEEELHMVFSGAVRENGLTEEENEELEGTADLDLMVALVMRGLCNLYGREEEGAKRRAARRQEKRARRRRAY